MALATYDNPYANKYPLPVTNYQDYPLAPRNPTVNIYGKAGPTPEAIYPSLSTGSMNPSLASSTFQPPAPLTAADKYKSATRDAWSNFGDKTDINVEMPADYMNTVNNLNKIGGVFQIGAGILNGGMQLSQLLKNPLPMQLRPQQLDNVEFTSPARAVEANLNAQNRSILASGLNSVRSTGGGNVEGLVAESLKNQLGIASTVSGMTTEATNRQTEANMKINAQNAQMALDYGAYKDDYLRAERDRKDQIRGLLFNTITSIPANIMQQTSDATASMAKIAMMG